MTLKEMCQTIVDADILRDEHGNAADMLRIRQRLKFQFELSKAKTQYYEGLLNNKTEIFIISVPEVIDAIIELGKADGLEVTQGNDATNCTLSVTL